MSEIVSIYTETHIMPSPLSKQQAKEIKRDWETHFNIGPPSSGPREEAPPPDESHLAEIASAKEEFETVLLGYPNVMGVGTGLKRKNNLLTDEPCLIVLVKKKVGEESLDRNEMIPRTIGGVMTDVVEIGLVEVLPTTH